MSAPTPKQREEREVKWTVTFCPECGWGAAVDEDGLCQTCGCTAVGRAVEEVACSLRTHSPEEPVAWRPWDTCPTDHRVVLAYFEPGHIETVCKDEEGWWFAYDGDRTDHDPTHWMARPPLPIGQPLDGEDSDA